MASRIQKAVEADRKGGVVNSLTSEVRSIQNPALGAVLIWRFVCGYVDSHRTRDSVPLPLAFLVLPIIMHSQTEGFVQSTQKNSGLQLFSSKFGKIDQSKQDLLLGIHERVIAFRLLSLESLRMGMATRLLHLNKALVLPLTQTPATPGISREVRRLQGNAEKLGFWCGQLTLHEIAAALKVRF